MSDREQVCPKTGLYLVPALGGDGWRIAKEEYVRSGGILSVRENRHVGPLPVGEPDRRGRFDTIGRTVYFGESEETAFAEVLQDFRRKRLAIEADAKAAGYEADEYIKAVYSQARANNVDDPWAIGGDWQLDRCVHQVAMPSAGWWVRANDKATMNQVSMDLAPKLREVGASFLTLADLTGESREVTTLVAEYIRNQDLFDGSRPLGIEFPSKTGYGTCWAWWNRRADDGLMPGTNDPKTVLDQNVDGHAFRSVASEWGLVVLPGRQRS